MCIRLYLGNCTCTHTHVRYVHVCMYPHTVNLTHTRNMHMYRCCSSRGHMGHGMQAVILDTSCTSSIHSLNLIIKQLVGSDEHHHSNQTLGNTDTNLSELEVRGQHSSASTSNSEPAAPVPHELCNSE